VEGLPSINNITVMKDFDPEEANTLEKELLAKWRELVLNKK
jgi:iron(III) transport system substrate-binding protein